MSDMDIEKLADRIAEKIEHRVCPLGMNKDAVESAVMWGRAQREVQAKQGAYVILLRAGNESDNIAVKGMRYLLYLILLGVAILLTKLGWNNLKLW